MRKDWREAKELMRQGILPVAAGVCAPFALYAAEYLSAVYLATSGRLSYGQAGDLFQSWAQFSGPLIGGAYGGFMAGLLASRRPVSHAMVAGALMVAWTLVHLGDYWGPSRSLEGVVVLVKVLPCAWVGGVVGAWVDANWVAHDRGPARDDAFAPASRAG